MCVCATRIFCLHWRDKYKHKTTNPTLRIIEVWRKNDTNSLVYYHWMNAHFVNEMFAQKSICLRENLTKKCARKVPSHENALIKTTNPQKLIKFGVKIDRNWIWKCTKNWIQMGKWFKLRKALRFCWYCRNILRS